MRQLSVIIDENSHLSYDYIFCQNILFSLYTKNMFLKDNMPPRRERRFRH